MNHVIKKPIAIISAEKAGLTEGDNLQRTYSLKEDLEALGLPYKAVLGMFEGTKEQSFVVVIKDHNQLFILSDLAEKYNQDSILYRNEYEDTYLLDGFNMKYIGKFVQVPEYVAKRKPTYTHDMTNNSYYITEL